MVFEKTGGVAYISGRYDNVLIDILCDILREKEVPLQVMRFLFRLLWRKELVLFAGGRECMILVIVIKLFHKVRFSALSYTILLGRARIDSSHLNADFFNVLMI
jgi:hypothetical protein